jgi:uncharacterized membrane protein YbhN (UPF0104 family)
VKIGSKYWKIVIFFVAYLFLAYKIYSIDFSGLYSGSLWLLLLPLLLVVVNWSLEANKWRFILVPLIGRVSFEEALNSVLTGLAAGVATPNRVGEYFGRMLMVENNEDRKRLFVASVYSSFIQALVTFFAGVVAIMFTGFALKIPLWLILSVIIGLVIIVLIFLYFKPKSFTEVTKAVKSQGIRGVFIVFSLSTFRYIVFIIQAYLVAKFFGFEGRVVEIFIAMSLMYFIVMFIPSFFWLELGIRGTVASVVFPLVGCNAGIGISTVSVVWLLNIAVPIIYISLRNVGKTFIAKYRETE